MSAAKTLLATSLALAPLLAACAAGDGVTRYTVTSVDRPAAAPLAEALAPGAALAALPIEAGRIVSVVQTRRSNGIDQKITLVGDAVSRGDNEIHVSTRTRARGTPAPTLDEASLESEMAERLPGVAMTIAPRVVMSVSGPIGVATGRTGNGVGCLYAWTNGVGDRPRGLTMAKALGIDGPESADLQVRVRLCRQGASDETLVALVEGLRVRSELAGTTGSNLVARGPAGRDALESAGYSGAASLAAPAPVATAWPPAETARTPSPIVAAAPPRVAAPAPVASAPRPVPAKPAAVVARAPRPATTTAAVEPAAPPVVAAPIPLPSGG